MMLRYHRTACSQLESKCFKTWLLRISKLMLSTLISTVCLQAWYAWMLKSRGSGAALWEVKSVLPPESGRCRTASHGCGFNGELTEVWKTRFWFLCLALTTWYVGRSTNLPKKCEEERVNGIWCGRPIMLVGSAVGDLEGYGSYCGELIVQW